jgi:hypothetical protein
MLIVHFITQKLHTESGYDALKEQLKSAEEEMGRLVESVLARVGG